MIVAGAAGGAALALIPAILRAFFSTNEIITSLMLNYVAALRPDVPDLRLASRTGATPRRPTAKVFPQGKFLPDAATLAGRSHVGGLALPFGLPARRRRSRSLVWVLYARTRFGFEVQVIGDSPRAATLRRHAHAPEDPRGDGALGRDRRHRRREPGRRLPPHARPARASTAAGYGYAGIVIAALARYNPFAVVLVAFLLGGLQNAGYALQGVDFPSGLVGVMQGLILFCALGGELLVRYRLRFVRSRAARRAAAASETRGVNNSILVVVLASAVAYGTPLLYAALGELLAERSGVLNLGVEGMMLDRRRDGLLGGAAAAGSGRPRCRAVARRRGRRRARWR